MSKPATLPPGITLHLAGPGEAGLLLDVMVRCWTGTVAANSSAFRETESDIAGQMVRGGGVLMLHSEAVIGGGRFHPVSGPAGDPREWVEIKRVGVLKDWRSCGLGAPLVSSLELEAMRRGHPGAQLGVRKDQPRLVAFWSALGYALADDVEMHTVNRLTPPPVTMRKWF